MAMDAHPQARAAWQAVMELLARERPRILAIQAEHDLRPPQVFALNALDEPAPMGRIAEALACDRSTVTWITDRLEVRGLVRRLPDPHDRRVTLLELTAEGRRVRSAVERKLAVPPPVFERLSDEEAEQLRALLGKLLHDR